MVKIRIITLCNALDEDDMFLDAASFWIGKEQRDLRVLLHMLNLSREQYARCHNEPMPVIIVEKEKWKCYRLSIVYGCEFADQKCSKTSRTQLGAFIYTSDLVGAPLLSMAIRQPIGLFMTPSG